MSLTIAVYMVGRGSHTVCYFRVTQINGWEPLLCDIRRDNFTFLFAFISLYFYGIVVTNKMGKMWKEMIVVCFKVQCRKKIQRELRETKVAKSFG